MDNFETRSRVYILLDEQGRVTRIEGEYSLPADLTGWTLIEEGAPCDRLNLAQSCYLDRPLYTEDGLPRWWYDAELGEVLPRPEELLEAERAALPAPVIPPTSAELAEENKLLKQQVAALAEQQGFYEDCIAEMAAVVYA